MKCMSRSTSGVILGTLNILVYVYVAVSAITDLVAINARNNVEKAKNSNPIKIDNYDSTYYPWDEDISSDRVQESINDAAISIGNTVFTTILVVALAMIIISGLLIVGIVKRRHSLMAPWLVLSAIGLISSCIRTALDLFKAIATGIPFGEIMFVFIMKSVTLCLTAFILYTIYTLYRDIRDKNKGLPGQIVTAGQAGFTYDYPIKSNVYTEVPLKA